MVHIPFPQTGLYNSTYRSQKRTKITQGTLISKITGGEGEEKANRKKMKTHYMVSYAESHGVFLPGCFRTKSADPPQGLAP